jgi:hypothetical protein
VQKSQQWNWKDFTRLNSSWQSSLCKSVTYWSIRNCVILENEHRIETQNFVYELYENWSKINKFQNPASNHIRVHLFVFCRLPKVKRRNIDFWWSDGILPVRRTPVCRTTFRRKPNSDVSPKDRFLEWRLAEQSLPNAWSVAWLG